jgi:HSP20 family protein
MNYKLYKPFTSFVGFDKFFDDAFNANSNFRFDIESKIAEDNSVSFTLDLPGVKQENLSVEITDNLVHIKAERKTKTSSYSVNKSLSLPEYYDPATLEAALEDGVLTLTVHPKKSEDKQTRKVIISNKK